MIELGLNAGLRVEEMASLTHDDLIIDNGRSSIAVLGKGGKKRARTAFNNHYPHIFVTFLLKKI